MIKLIIAVFLPAFIYMIVGFIVMDFNPAHWTEGVRMFSILVLICSWFMTLLYITEPK